MIFTIGILAPAAEEQALATIVALIDELHALEPIDPEQKAARSRGNPVVPLPQIQPGCSLFQMLQQYLT